LRAAALIDGMDAFFFTPCCIDAKKNKRWRREGEAYDEVACAVGDVLAEAVLVHDPVGALAAGGAAAVEDERLAEAVDAAVAGDAAVLAGGLPVPRRRGAVGAGAVGVLAVPGAEEEPFQVSFRQERLLCDYTI
jgi:hypothetical protein